MVLFSLVLMVGCTHSSRKNAGQEALISDPGPENSDSLEAEAEAWEAKAMAALDAGKGGLALSHYEQAIALARVIDDGPLLSRLLNDRGVAQVKIGLRAQAMESFGEAYSVRLGEVEGGDVSPILYNQGMVHWQLGRLTAAIRTFEEALALAPIEERGALYLNLSELYLEEGEGALCLERARQGRAWVDEMENEALEVPPRSLPWALTQEGLCLGWLGEDVAAIARLGEASLAWEEAGDLAQAGQGAFNLALIALDGGQDAQARQGFDIALKHATALGDGRSVEIIESYLEDLGAGREESSP